MESETIMGEPQAKRIKLTNGNSSPLNGSTTCDKEYFLSYNDVEIHKTMIEDEVRTTAYQQALFKKMEEYIKGKVVADIGCGTGILSMFCAQAGAKKVYAIDASEIVHQAEILIEENNFKDTIKVLKGKAEEVELPEKVDVIVSEWMGFLLLNETMLPSVLIFRDKWLKPDGKMFPERATIHMALADTQWITKYEEQTYDFWVSIKHLYDLDMSKLADKAVQKYKELIHVHMVAQEDVISLPTTVCDLDLNTIKTEEIELITHKFTLKSMGSRHLNSIVLWFDVYFPGGYSMSTSPDLEDTHWQNSVLPLNVAKLRQDDEIQGEINISQRKNNQRNLQVRLDYSLNGGDILKREFIMEDYDY